ncbi:phycobilisome protein [Laspinema olomoucense]|uniref:Phycobilisome protein n=1 Tax=Laspinema olomoucense D3b TaxID=2953688 RepID=A0ABT2N278_9CYAN|nr:MULTISPECIES: phycobilisome protein [unclassified Laspinema]MCT7974754.1 phycobilisome protein [Laspinema sp. D3d]MCT7976792.1 phycobilisome protein [Laspinema sp. D3b]MCT7990353.1 phycobilisome protein [Laspinema sp. D3a]MCT7994896.1 phycobilisome protein [Laspinema sp. D3c]
MQAINSKLQELINENEGQYLSPGDLQGMKRYLQTFAERVKTYEMLREKGDLLVRHALKKFMSLHPDIMQKHGQRCYYDMTQVMRYSALAILKDDPRFFNDSLVLWQSNILTAYQRQNSCGVAYRCLKETTNAHLPSSANQYLDPYINRMIEALDIPPKLMANVQKAAIAT